MKEIAPSDHRGAPIELYQAAADYLNDHPPLSPYAGTPRELHLGLADSPEQMRVTWVTMAECSDSYVAWGASSDPGSYESWQDLEHRTKADTYTYTTPPRWWPDFRGYIHSAVMDSLAPGERFTYAVGSPRSDALQHCEISNLTVGLAPHATSQLPVNLAMMADVGSIMPLGFATWEALANRFEDLDLQGIVHGGDVSYAGMDTAIPILNVSKDDEFEPLWDLYGDVIAPVARQLAYQVGVGNHEAWYNWTAVRHRYPMTHNSPAASASLASPPFWYAYEMGGVHFTMLSTEHDMYEGSPQWEFADAVLSNVDRERTPWSVVIFHRAYYCSEEGYNAESHRLDIEPFLLANDVDFVATGHLHGYERTHAVANNTVVATPAFQVDGADVYDRPGAPVYVMIGNGGAAQEEHWQMPAPEYSAVRYSQGCDYTGDSRVCGVQDGTWVYTDTYGFFVTKFVNSTHAYFQTEMVTGELQDKFWIVRA